MFDPQHPHWRRRRRQPLPRTLITLTHSFAKEDGNDKLHKKCSIYGLTTLRALGGKVVIVQKLEKECQPSQKWPKRQPMTAFGRVSPAPA